MITKTSEDECSQVCACIYLLQHASEEHATVVPRQNLPFLLQQAAGRASSKAQKSGCRRPSAKRTEGSAIRLGTIAPAGLRLNV
jgi:hypothetical protein